MAEVSVRELGNREGPNVAVRDANP